MGKAEVLSLLRDGEYVSGEEISRALGVTRAAVWKAVQALRPTAAALTPCRIGATACTGRNRP